MSYLKNQYSLPLTDPLFQKHSVELIKLIREYPLEKKEDINKLVDEVQEILFRYRDQLQEDVGKQLIEREIIVNCLHHIKSLIESSKVGLLPIECDEKYLGKTAIETLKGIKLHVEAVLASKHYYVGELRNSIYSELIKEIFSMRVNLNDLATQYDHLRTLSDTIEHKTRIETLKSFVILFERKFGSNHGYFKLLEDEIKKVENNFKNFDRNHATFGGTTFVSQLKHYEHVLKYFHDIDIK